MIADRSQKGQLTLRVMGVNTSTYRRAVTASLQEYYTQAIAKKSTATISIDGRAAPASLRYPLPSWMPLPGQCSMRVRMQKFPCRLSQIR